MFIGTGSQKEESDSKSKGDAKAANNFGKERQDSKQKFAKDGPSSHNVWQFVPACQAFHIDAKKDAATASKLSNVNEDQQTLARRFKHMMK